ncbi:MAG: polysaccharide deacetylase family protein [Rubrivivax sp.]|nr:polysaccharide deacetylase family protein [Rubrivivax sp.]
MSEPVGVIAARLPHPPSPHGPVMLMYHAVHPQDRRPAWPWAVSLASFERQLDFLQASGYDTPTVSELLAAPDRLRRRTAVITFDDGYADNVEAAGALQRRGMRATWYMVSGSIGRAPEWPFDGRPAGRLMDAAELRALQDAGMEIGSHSASHRRMTELDPQAQLREAVASKSDLEDLLGTEVHSFAYPYGAVDAACAAAVREAGYRSACTTDPGWMLRDGDPFRLRRLTVFNHDTLGTFRRKLVFASHDVNWLHLARYWARRAVQRVTGRG